MVALLPKLRADSMAQCPGGERYYLQAATALCTAAAAVLPPPHSAAAMALPQQLGLKGSFYAIHLAALLGGYAGVLTVLFRFELSHRRTFARQRRLAAEALALLRRRGQWAIGLPLVVLACVVGWLACCALVLLALRLAA